MTSTRRRRLFPGTNRSITYTRARGPSGGRPGWPRRPIPIPPGLTMARFNAAPTALPAGTVTAVSKDRAIRGRAIKRQRTVRPGPVYATEEVIVAT